MEDMPNENDSENLAPNFHGAYRKPDEEGEPTNEQISQPDKKFRDASSPRFDYEIDSYGNVFSNDDLDRVSEEGISDIAESSSRDSRKSHFLSRPSFIIFIALALILGGVLIGIYGWVESEEITIQQTETSSAESDSEPLVNSTPPVSEQDQQDEAGPLLQQSPPIPGESIEPVTSVALAVSPSVVRIDTSTGTGSGIILDSSGRVVTNAHVVNGARTVEIRLADGTRAEGTVLGSDPNVDIAIVQIEGEVLFQEANFALSDTVQVGQLAVAIGSPFGLEQSVTAGIVSAVNRAVPHANVTDGSPTIVEMIQTDAPINPGNSGGALADRQGRVVGMNTSIRTDGIVSGNLGVGFAIPSDTILLVADRIVNGESLDVGFLGVSGQNPALGRAGALIIDVVEESPAWDGGLMPGDLVVSVDGSPILGMSELAAKIRISSPGTEVEIGVIRNGEEAFFKVILGTLGSN
tara:strand:+ start:4536 stop:5930 length:1395 start_codon:yes stop_codon:yes gene_type:complete